jgi:hypothetical protein
VVKTILASFGRLLDSLAVNSDMFTAQASSALSNCQALHGLSGDTTDRCLCKIYIFVYFHLSGFSTDDFQSS